MRKIVLLAILFIFFSGKMIIAQPIPEDFKKTVTFIFIKNEKGQIIPNGTGFFVSVKNEIDSQRIHGYLVTAKHVIFNKKTNSLYKSVYIRLNTKAGNSKVIRISTHGPKSVTVFYYDDLKELEDSNVDLAVIPFFPKPTIYDFKTIPPDIITTKEKFKELNIAEGDELFFIGLFTPYIGNKRNFPITRFGKVALITDEKIPWKDKGDKDVMMQDLYIFETQSFGGNSGSPVFFRLGPTRKPGQIVIGPSTILLGGIIKGFFLDAKEIQFADARKTPFAVENIGISAAIPSYKLYEMLFSNELKDMRVRSVEK